MLKTNGFVEILFNYSSFGILYAKVGVEFIRLRTDRQKIGKDLEYILPTNYDPFK